MHRPPAVNALFAGHSLPRTAKALDQIREHITLLEANQNNAKPAEPPCAPWRSDKVFIDSVFLAHAKRNDKTYKAHNDLDHALNTFIDDLDDGDYHKLRDHLQNVTMCVQALENAVVATGKQRSKYDTASVKAGPVILDDDGEA